MDKPCQSEALTRFLAESPCPFAQRAQVMVLPAWPAPAPCRPLLDGLQRALSRFTRQPEFDIAILEVDRAGEMRDLDGWAGWLRDVLVGLRQRDATTTEPLLAGIGTHEWDFRFEGAAFFLSLFAPLYPADHSRHSGEADVAFLLLQPEHGFRRFGISSSLPGRQQLSAAVHRRFARRGTHYDLENNLLAPKALRYVKPLAPGDPPIAWWVDRAEAPSRESSAGSAEPR